VAQEYDFDYEVTRCSLFGFEYGIASENCGARVPTNVRCAPRFLLSSHLLGPESRTFKLSLKKGMLKSPTLMTMHRAVVDSTSNMRFNRKALLSKRVF